MATVVMASPPSAKRSFTAEDNDHFDSSQKRQRTVGENLKLEAESPLSLAEASDDETRFQQRPKKYRCDHEGCGKVFDRPCRLEEHIRQHTGERPFVCEEIGCGKSFQRDYHLSRHKRDSHANVRNHACSYEGCTQKFATSQRLRNHEKTHEKKVQYQCKDYPPCNEQFRKKSTLQAHISEQHLGQDPYKCTLNDSFTSKPCLKGFKTSQQLHRHFNSVHSGHRFTCTACSSVLSTPTVTESSVLNDAMSENTVATSMASCAVFPTHQALQQHIKDCHPESLPPPTAKPKKDAVFACEHDGCSSKFNKHSNLKAHIRNVHDKQKRFVCGTTDLSKSKNIGGVWDGQGCGEGFVYKHLLEQHVRSQHLGLVNQPTSRAQSRKQTARSGACIASLLGDVRLSSAAEVQSSCSLCDAVYATDDDLIQHYVEDHHLAEAEIGEHLLEGHARSGGPFWVGGVEPDDDMNYDMQEEGQIEDWFDKQEELRSRLEQELRLDPQLRDTAQVPDAAEWDSMEL